MFLLEVGGGGDKLIILRRKCSLQHCMRLLNSPGDRRPVQMFAHTQSTNSQSALYGVCFWQGFGRISMGIWVMSVSGRVSVNNCAMFVLGRVSMGNCAMFELGRVSEHNYVMFAFT